MKKQTKRFTQPPERQKNRLVQVKVSEEEKRIIEEFALASGTTISEVVRKSTLDAAAASDASLVLRFDDNQK